MQSGKKKWALSIIAASAITAGSYFGSMELLHNSVRADTPAATAQPTPEPAKSTVAPGNDLSRAFRAVHDSMENAVVNISVTKKAEAPAAGQGGIRQFRFPPGFQLPPGFGQQGAPDQGDAEPVSGTGSGVIVSPDGYILTNNHVVDGADDIQVTLDDTRKFPAKVIGVDPKTDLAVVKIDADHLTYAKFGDSDAINVGDWVLAFGSPFGFNQTMTQGIISAKHRQIDIIAQHNPSLAQLTYEDFLQTDAAINPGNSGGPLVNLAGEIVGINAAIASQTGAYNGIGFSIPANEAQYIMDSLIKHGKVVRGFLNVAIEDINNPNPQDEGLAKSIKKAGFTGKGALVSQLAPDGPAGKGGVQGGDVITALNHKSLETVRELRMQVARIAPGTNITLTVFRDGKAMDLTFPVGTQPATIETIADATGDADVKTGSASDLGLEVRSLGASTIKDYKMGTRTGVIISSIDQRGLGAQSGLAVGDVITSVNRAVVASPADLTKALGKANLAEGVRLTVRSANGMERLVFIEKQ